MILLKTTSFSFENDHSLNILYKTAESRTEPEKKDGILRHTTGFPAKSRLRNKRRIYSILMAHLFLDLSSAFDWSKFCFN